MAPKKKAAAAKPEPKAPEEPKPKATGVLGQAAKATPAKPTSLISPKATAAVITQVPAAKSVPAPKVAATPLANPKPGSLLTSAPKAPQMEAAKRKLEEEAAATPLKKEAKTEVKEEKGDVKLQELEEDAAVDSRPVFKGAAGFNAVDTTLNCVPTSDGEVLMGLSQGGMQYLIAGARANLGVKEGRYMFEVKILETLTPTEPSQNRARMPQPRQVLRVGFSTGGSSLVLGDSDEHVCFDSDGSFYAGKTKKVGAAQKFVKEQVIAVVLNLSDFSANANTLSLFRDGVRISEPQPIPEIFRGKPIFPHISYRNLSVFVNLGAKPVKDLSFSCRTIGNAADADVESVAEDGPEDGKYEVVFPVAFPDEGTFDWLDTFLEKNPRHVELSDRKIVEWAASSGLLKPKAAGQKGSNDKPEFNFGLTGMDNYSVQKVVAAVAPLVPRNYVVMEVKSNLVEDERKSILDKFRGPHFKKVAHVVMGEPTEDFKALQVEKTLKEKQEKSDAAWKAKKVQDEQRKVFEQKQKQLADIRKKAEDARKKQLEEAKKKAEAAKKAEELKKKREAGEIVDDEEMETDEVKDEVKEEEDDKLDEDMDDEDKPPEVELTEEEQNRWFKPTSAGSSDLTAGVLNQFFGKFSIPESSEGFDDIRYEWQDAATSKDYLRKWVLDRKRSARLEHLEPGEWFDNLNKEWVTKFAGWQAKQKQYKAGAVQREKAAVAKKKAELEKMKALGVEDEAMETEAAKPEEVDVFAAGDICDVGEGTPLFKDFVFEDWAMLQLRYELYILQEAFKKDVDDPDIPGVHETHLSFYYNKYFRKQLLPKSFNLSAMEELVALCKVSVFFDEKDKVLAPKINAAVEDDSAEAFVRLSEESRRERQRRIDAGDETARLKFAAGALQPAPSAPKAGSWGGAPAKAAGAWPASAGGPLVPQGWLAK